MGATRSRWVIAALLALGTAAPAFADAKAEEILKQAFGTLHRAKSLTADLSLRLDRAGAPGDAAALRETKGTLAVLKPNFLRVELQETVTFVADGKSYFAYYPQLRQYLKQPLEPKPTALQGAWGEEINAFFGGGAGLREAEISYVGAERVGQVACEVVRVKMRDPERTVTYAVGKEDHLIHRSATTSGQGDAGSLTQTITLSNIKLNTRQTEADFAFKPPEGAKEYQRPNYEANLVAVGKQAPALKLPTPDGGSLSLDEARKGKKAVVVNFWFHG